ncbi:Disks large-associated protein 5 [Eufriesea mexicana]|nr:Disks large-associated protein 5 [Eufriesea mexicana]
MSNLRQEYKKKTTGFGNIAENRFIRAKKYEESRKQQRSEKFNTNRNISTDLAETQNKEIQLDSLAKDRMTRLMKWKAEREKRKKIEQSKKKPAFIVGTVHHKIYSPPKEDTSIKMVKKSEPVPKRITKLTEKRLINKALAKKTNAKTIIKNPNSITKVQQTQKIDEPSSIPKIATELPCKPIFGRVVLQNMSPAKMNAISRKSNLNNKSNNTIFDIKNDVPIIDSKCDNCDIKDSSVESISLKLSLDNKESLHSLNSNSSDSKDLTSNIEIRNDSLIEAVPSNNNISIPIESSIPHEPVFFSPYIVSSRGKSNARKEQQLKRGFSLSRSSNDDIPTKDTVMKTLNISVEEEERTAQYFQFLLNRERDRLNDLCEKWVQIKTDPETTEDGLYIINQAIGQTKLLISKKFERFRGLVADCETGKGEMLVTCKDLQGFWDMMYMEVENCNLRFEKLEKLRSHGWKEEELLVDGPITKKRTTTKKKLKSAKPGSIRSFIAEKKKNVTEKMKNNNDTNRPESNKNQILGSKYQKNENLSSKKYTRRSMPIESSEKKHALAKRKKLSLLQQIQLSEISKKTSSPLTIIKISQMCKTPEVQLDDSISYVNSNQTPRKSILKQPKNSTTIESHVKPVNQVNFDDDIILNEVPIDEETQTKMDLAAALSRIDNFNFNDPDYVTIRAEKKLVFDDSSDENDDGTNQNLKLNNSTNNDTTTTYMQTQATTPLAESDKKLNALQRRSIKRQNAVDEDSMIVNQTRFLSINSSTPFKKVKGDTDLNISKQEHFSANNKEDTSKQGESMKILRNRIIIPTEIPMAKRRSVKNVSVSMKKGEQVNTTPCEGTKKESSFKVNIYSSERVNVNNSFDNLQESSKKRRFGRSVKFLEKADSGLINKPTLPMTPHVRRSRKSSIMKEKSNEFIEDPIPLEIQEKRNYLILIFLNLELC